MAVSITLTLSIAQALDDANTNNTGWHNDSSTGVITATNTQRIFLRFPMNIPVGSTIQSAVVDFAPAATNSTSMTSNIRLLDRDDCPSFATDLSAASPTATTVSWVVSSWTQNTGFTSVSTSSDISTIVQSFINRSGFVYGNHMGLRFSQSAGLGSRTAYLYENGSNMPRLRVQFTLPVADDYLESSTPLISSNIAMPTGRSTRIQVTDEGSDAYADRIQFQIFQSDQSVSSEPTSSNPYPITITTNDDGIMDAYSNIIDSTKTSLDLWLPPTQSFKFRVRRRIGVSYEDWSDTFDFAAAGFLNSYELYQLLTS